MKKSFAALLALIFVLALVPAALAEHETYVDCYNEACPGYCYCYDQPSSINGHNLGRFNNGTPVTVYSRSNGWCYVSGYNTKGAYIYGYVHYWALEDPGPDDNDISPCYSGRYVDCHHSACPGYCYVYDQPSSTRGNNLGRFNNGTRVDVYDYVNGWYYVSGYNSKGAYIYGYVHDWALN